MSRQDFQLEQNNDGTFDMTIDPDIKDFGTVEGMETAFNVQLFVDQRVSKEEIAVPLNRKGWIGDMVNREQGYQMGSLLHLQEMARDTQLDNNETAAYAKDALEYFVSIGSAKEVTAEVVGKNIEGKIVAQDNKINRYSKLWRSTNAT